MVWLMPTSALDPKTQQQLIELLKTFHRTLIIATHDLDIMLDLYDHTIILQAGRVVTDGPARDLLQDNELLRARGLEKPLCMQASPIIRARRPQLRKMDNLSK